MSAFIKLPESLKSWKIISRLSDEKGNELYKVSKKDYDGTVISALLRYIVMNKDDYTIENTDFINDEVGFLKTIAQSGECFNYLDIFVNNNPAKKKIEFFIITEDLKTLSDVIKSKTFSESEIIDFGIQMSTILERLESKNIFHGNLNPDNIFVTLDGKYKLGGFSDFEGKISDMSFIAPEIFKKENADFTTDLYSLGLIMYCMSNDSALPFEADGVNKEDAINKRFEGKSVTAPKNGSEKLKSIIVIACQPNNDNRWKNAGNIKNALTSIKNEAIQQSENLIIPESTDFDGNVFEEYEYEDFDDTAKAAAEVLPVMGAVLEQEPVVDDINQPQENSSDSKTDSDEVTETADNTVEAASDDNPEFVEIEAVTKIDSSSDFETENPSDFAEEVSDKPEINKIIEFSEQPTVNTVENTKPEDAPTDVTTDKDNSLVETNDLEIDNRVFETYEVQKKAKNFQQQAKEKDYGDFFEDSKTAPEKASEDKGTSEFDVENDNELNVFETDNFDDEPAEKTSKSKKNVVIIILCVAVMLGALSFIAYCIISGLVAGGDNKDTTAQTTTAQSTTANVTTVVPTTAEPTTVAVEKNVIPVVGYGYSYAKELLEQDGFTVEIGEYEYSEEWPEGYVIAQTPSGDTSAKKGSVVTLDISLGLIEPETTAAPTEAPVQETQVPERQNSNSSSNSYLFANSASAYLSKSDVSALSDNNLNLALNEIYARRGRIFSDSYLSSYFNSKSWYTPKYSADQFSKNVTFNDYEQSNLQLMVDEQKSRGLR